MAVNDTVSVARDSSNNAINVLANDSDPDGDALSITQVSSPAHGSAVIAGNQISYTPTPGFFGSDAFTYTIGDGHAGSASASVAITVTDIPNRPPVIASGGITVGATFNTPTTIDLLTNASDPDHDTLTVTAVGMPAHGTVTLTGNSATYTPAIGYSGSDSFNYTISDGRGGTVTGVVMLTVSPQSNRPPVANNDAASTAMDTAVTIPVLANDSDPDGDVLTVTLVGTPANGTATLNGNSVTYTPGQNFTGNDSFPYTISDGHGHSATATVTITVTPIPNRPPIANNDAASTAMDTAVTVPVLANDSDPDGDVLTVTSVGTPANGTATLNGNSLTYTPGPGFTGSDSFPYTISDGHGHSATATVTITVTPIINRPPVANNDAASTAMDTAVSIAV
ncbi:MAG: Ig-like domain-containing protein, partial [Dokdonella sp.]